MSSVFPVILANVVLRLIPFIRFGRSGYFTEALFETTSITKFGMVVSESAPFAKPFITKFPR